MTNKLALLDLEEKIITDINGVGFAHDYRLVYFNVSNLLLEIVNKKELNRIYTIKEKSIYSSVVKKYLAENPELIAI